MAEVLHVSPRSLACDPAVAARVVEWRVFNWRVLNWPRGRRDLPIEAHRRFQSDQWFAKSNVFDKTFIQLPCFCFEHADIYLAVQLIVLPGSLIWLYRRSPQIYRQLRNTVAGAWLIGTPIFAPYPVAPPRLAGIGLRTP